MKSFIALFVAAVLALIGINANAGLTGIFGNNNTNTPILGGTTRLVCSGTAGVTATNIIAIGFMSTNTFGTPSSGTGLGLSVIDHDYVGYTFSFTGSTNTTLQVYESMDYSNTFNPQPAFVYSGSASSSTFYTNGYWDVHGASHLGFLIINTGTIDASNLLLEINAKDSKMIVKTAPN